MSNHPISVHIGLIKSASTTLQRVARTTDGLYFPPVQEVGNWQKRATRKGFDEARPDFLRIAEEAKAFDGPALISRETLSALPGEQFAELLEEALPGCRVFVISRNPVDWAMSSYKKLIRHGFTSPIEKFITRRLPGMLSSFDFDGLVEAYGRHGIAVDFIPFELLVQDRAAFFAMIERTVGFTFSDFKLEAAANPTPPHELLEMIRASSNLFRTILAKQDDDSQRQYATLLYKWTSNLNKIDDEKIAGLLPHFNIVPQSELRGALDAHAGDLFEAVSPRMSVLRTIPEYEPFLEQYGLR